MKALTFSKFGGPEVLEYGDVRRRRGGLAIAPRVAYALADGGEAHAFLEGGLSAGKVLLVP